MTHFKRPILLAGIDLPTAVDAVCQLMPLDYFIPCPARYMSPSEGASLPPLGAQCHQELTDAIHRHAPSIAVEPLERFAFYDEAGKAFAVVQCVGERRPYGNVILTKGVVGPDGNDLKP